MTEESLEDRVTSFMLLELPGQPRMMHMGTSHLVHDLAAEVKKLRDAIGSALEDLENGNEDSASMTLSRFSQP